MGNIKAIRSEADYNAALARIEALMAMGIRRCAAISSRGADVPELQPSS